MKLNQLAAKPTLIKFELDDEDIIKEFGEPIEFYSWDRQPIDVFMKLANASQQDMSGMIDIIKGLILDEDANPILKDDMMLPSAILVKAIGKIVEKLGK